jgi:protein SCO1/2
VHTFHCIFVLLTLGYSLPANADEQAFGLSEKPGTYLPEDIVIRTEDSVEIHLNELIAKPTLLSFVYYHCPELCPKSLEGIAELVNYSEAVPGIDYQIITLSIDHREPASLARSAKLHYTGLVTNSADPYFWRFLTADSSNIRKLTQAVGWDFKEEGDNFVHTTSAMLITPAKMVSQYFYGTYFNYMHFTLSVEKAANELIVPTRLKTLKYCYNYKPGNNSLLQTITYVSGSGTILAVILLFLYLTLRKRKLHAG